MKKLLLVAVLSIVSTSCIPDKGKIDKDKKSRSADSIRNDGVDSAAANSQNNTADTISR